MADPQKHPAIAEDGPVADDRTLTVDDHDSEGRWRSPVVWTTGPDPRQLYGLSGLALSPSGAPVYRHERTLDPGEPDPPAGRVKPPS
jgi:hypothetical protein